MRNSSEGNDTCLYNHGDNGDNQGVHTTSAIEVSEKFEKLSKLRLPIKSKGTDIPDSKADRNRNQQWINDND